MSMKRTLVYLTFLVLLASPLAFARAEDDATTSDDASPIVDPIRKAEQARERLQERDEKIKDALGERRETMEQKRTEIQERTREHVGLLLDRVLARFTAAVERLENVYDRILARIELIEEARDIDLTDARAHLEDAKEFITQAKDALADIPDEADGIFGTSTASTTIPSAGISSIRNLFTEAKTLIRSAHGALVEAIASIKTGLGDKDDEATSTDSN